MKYYNEATLRYGGKTFYLIPNRDVKTDILEKAKTFDESTIKKIELIIKQTKQIVNVAGIINQLHVCYSQTFGGNFIEFRNFFQDFAFYMQSTNEIKELILISRKEKAIIIHSKTPSLYFCKASEALSPYTVKKEVEMRNMNQERLKIELRKA